MYMGSLYCGEFHIVCSTRCKSLFELYNSTKLHMQFKSPQSDQILFAHKSYSILGHKYCIAGKFGELTRFEHLAKESLVN